MAMAARIHNALTAKSGQSATELAASLRIPLAALKLPMAKLLAEKVVTTTGQRRGTKYHAGGSASRAMAAKPATRTTAKSAKAKSPAAKPGRKPMSPDAKAALLERLAKARAARSAAK
jgi:hypothetical protein